MRANGHRAPGAGPPEVGGAAAGAGWADRAPAHLTPLEFDLLVHLAGQPRTVVSREVLLAKVWGWSDGAGARTVDSHVKALRRKHGADLIRTVHGVATPARCRHVPVA